MHRSALAALPGSKHDPNRVWIDVAAVAQRPLEGGALHAPSVEAELGRIAVAMVTVGSIGTRDELQDWCRWVEDEIRHASHIDRGV